ncbi:hypothetical protein IAR50_004899 [Cryptococcus sp. DSM 104548]
MSPYDAVVLGAGVLGLSIAHELTRKGLKVAVVAKDLPEDLDSTGFASPWAGANWHSVATNEAERRRDKYTFEQFERLAKEVPHLCERRPYATYWSEDGDGGYGECWYTNLVFNFRYLDPSEVPTPFKHGVAYEAYTLNTPLYLLHLASSLRALHVPIIRHRLSSLSEAYNLLTLGPVDLVINATGLGALSLLGVEDSTVYPARGQTILARAPWVKTSYGINDKPVPDWHRIYIIPRPGPDGHVILGGVFRAGDWSTGPDAAVAERILQDVWKVCPALDGKEGKGSWRDIQIVSHNVGLRPCRRDGLRLELEHFSLGAGVKQGLETLKGENGKGAGSGRQVGVLHAYGIGPAGYQSSLGVAKEAGEKVGEWLKGSGRAKL